VINFGDLKCDILFLDSILEIINHILGHQKSSFLEKKYEVCDQICNKYEIEESNSLLLK
jgi:hypothetical protein